jgi:DNA-directed RNA polymerase subunit alpha
MTIEALRLYERAASCFPAHVGTLINLGVVYEDRNEFAKAQACYKRSWTFTRTILARGCT